jgi:hypothetical protein
MGIVPVWFREEKESSMQVDDRIRFCTGFVGMGSNEKFTAHGTCFCVYLTEDDFTFDYLISAQHLLWPSRRRNPERPPDTAMTVRLNTTEGTSRVIQTPPKDWIYPDDPSIDICALRFDELAHTADDSLFVNSINLQTMIIGPSPHSAEQVGLCLGDEVFICGAFVGRVGYRKNIPVVRIANIAAMPDEPIDLASPRKPAYLIETRSLGGTSGAPVFLNLQSQRIARQQHAYQVGISPANDPLNYKTHLIFPYLLIGMFIYFHGGNFSQDFVAEDDSEIHPLKDADFNAGIGVALPVSLIIDLLDSDKAKAARMVEIDRKRKQSGARPASAIRHIPSDHDAGGDRPANDVNPKHREDFNSLVGAAVKKPVRED